jgi:hypothetical protein
MVTGFLRREKGGGIVAVELIAREAGEPGLRARRAEKRELRFRTPKLVDLLGFALHVIH